MFKQTSTFLFQIILILFLSSSSFAIVSNDNGQISATNVSRVVHVQSEADILKALQDANSEHIPIAIMGRQHSQGGQSLAPKAIELDMLSFSKILGINAKKKQVTVQSGIIWSDLQKYINQYNLAIKSMQSPNIFTVGGSMSVNAHGDDFRAGAVGNSIVAFHIVLANGKKVFVSPDSNPDLWAAVIGGYGLFGVVTDVTLQLTDNNLLVSSYEETDLADFPAYFRRKILTNKNAVLFYAHLDIVNGSNFLRNMYVITYKNTHVLPNKVISLDNPDKWNTILTPMFNISRHGKLGKTLRWNLEKKIFSKFYNNRVVTRNNAMEKPVKFASDHHSKYDADWLQEYFIPVDELPQFITKMRNIFLENNVNLLNVTIRYVPAEKNIFLAYAKNDCFAVVLYFNQNLSQNNIEQAQSWTRSLINTALSLNGSYYLPYQLFAEKSQFKKAYPGCQQIIKFKRIYDPNKIFVNTFYQHYLE